MNELPDLPPGRSVRLPGRGSLLVRDVAGPAGAPTVLLLHGWTVTADLNWFAAYAPLAEHFRVVAVDHCGHGQGIRTGKRFSLEDCADDAAAVADILGIDRFVPVGYSMGGTIAMLLWQRHRHRVDGLVLCATARNFRGSGRDKISFPLLTPVAHACRLAPRDLDRRLFDWAIDKRVAGRGYHQWIIDEIKAGDPRQLANAGRAIGRFDASPWIDRIDVPAGVVVIADDSIVPTHRQHKLAAAIATARTWVVPGDHDVVVTDPALFNPSLVAACAHAASHHLDVTVTT